MRFKRKLLFLIFILTFIFATNILCSNVVNAEDNLLYLGGIPSGFTLKTNGAIVIGLSDIATENGVISPAKNAEIKIGDRITKIGNEKISGANSIAKILSKSKGEPIEITVVRKGETITKFLTPYKDNDGNYKLGVFLRDDLNGIGTITYFTKDGEFAALGHPVLDENQDYLDLNCGESYLCSIYDVTKGEKGKAGELKGIFVDLEKIGCISKNLKTGIYGKTYENYNFKQNPLLETGQAKIGNAVIFTCIDGVLPKEYSINVVKVDANNKENKNFVIKVTDKKLLNATNGILQGMSGSPIVQDGKIIGAVTHVFINDPTRGYGISIDKMLKN